MVENREYLSLVFEKNPQPTWIYASDTLAFLAVNEAAIRQYGYSREEFLALTIRDIRPPEDIPLLLRYRAGVDEEARPWRHRKKDGTIFDVEISATDLQFEGRRARLVVATDVTERKRMEASLVESEARLRTYLESASEGIVVVDRAGRIEYMNARTEEMFGYTRRQLLGEAIEILLPERYQAMHVERREEYVTAPTQPADGDRHGAGGPAERRQRVSGRGGVERRPGKGRGHSDRVYQRHQGAKRKRNRAAGKRAALSQPGGNAPAMGFGKPTNTAPLLT